MCGNTFTTLNYLKKHISVIHEGAKDYSCDFCGKKFGHKVNLDAHIR